MTAGVRAVLVLAGLAAGCGPAWAQPRPERPPATPAPAPPPAVPPPAAHGPQVAGASASGWTTSCSSLSRQGSQDCTISQSVQLARTGQVVARVSVRVPGDTRAAALLIELPLGLHLPAGVRMQVDDGKPAELPFQTCQAQGCVALAPIDAAMLAALKAGQQMSLAAQLAGREPLTLSMPLEGFAASFDRVR